MEKERDEREEMRQKIFITSDSLTSKDPSTNITADI